MATITQTAKYVRSKNAGPFWLTIDIFCGDSESFRAFKNSKNFTAQTFSDIYRVDKEKVKIFFVENLNVIKVSVPRPQIQGHKYERDMHCGQQYVRILDVEL